MKTAARGESGSMTSEPGHTEDRVAEPSATHHRGSSLIGGKRLTAAIVLGVLLLSAASLILSLHTNSLVRENARLARASSTPILFFDTGNVTDEGVPRLNFTVSNAGLGPARIIWFQIRHKGVAHGNLSALVQSSGVPQVQLQNTLSNPLVQTLLRPGEDRHIILWNRPESASDPQMAAWQAVDRDRFSYQVEACYCSLLNECWESTLNGDDPKPVRQCTAEGRPSFGNTRILRQVSGQAPPG
jgi:hypothetical protein